MNPLAVSKRHCFSHQGAVELLKALAKYCCVADLPPCGAQSVSGSDC